MAKSTTKKGISIREFAKQIGTSHTAVNKAIKEKKFTVGYNTKTKTIDPEKAASDVWVQQQANVKPKAGVSRSKAVEKMETQQQFPVPEENSSDLPDINSEDVDLEQLIKSIKITADLTFQEASRRREVVALALDKIKLKKEEGILVEKARVEAALFQFGNELKKELFNIPKRIASDIMAAPNEVEAINIINDELIRVLNEMSNYKL